MRLIGFVSGLALVLLAMPANAAVDDDGNFCFFRFWECWYEDTHITSTGSMVAYEGVPVWSSNGNYKVGVQEKYLWQWTGVVIGLQQPVRRTKNHESRIFIEPADGGSRQFIGEFLPGKVNQVYFMEEEGYFLFSLTHEDRSYYIMTLDGEVTLVDVFPPPVVVTDSPDGVEGRRCRGAEIYPSVLPSPDGRVLAQVECAMDEVCWDERRPTDGTVTTLPLDLPPRPATCELTFLDPWSLEVLGPVSEVLLPDLPRRIRSGPNGAWTNYEPETWTTDNELVITDRETTAFAAVPGEVARPIPVPSCHGPRTTSSKVNDDGQRLGVERTPLGLRLRVVDDVLSAMDTFGCPSI